MFIQHHHIVRIAIFMKTKFELRQTEQQGCVAL